MSRGGWRFAAAGVVAALPVTATVADAQAERVRWKMHSAYATNIAVLGEAPGVLSETVKKLSHVQFRDRKIVVSGRRVSGRVDQGGRRIIKQKRNDSIQKR